MKIAVISDIHEDYHGLLKASRLIEKAGCDLVICLGDIVGFSVPFYKYLDTRDASGCVSWVKANCRYSIAGNHDMYAVRRLPESQVRDFRFPADWYQLPFNIRQEMALGRVWLYEDHELSALLTAEASEYLLGLPEVLVIEESGFRSLLTHFISPDITGSATEFLVEGIGLAEHLRLIRELGCTIGFSGHMHPSGLLKASGLHLQNPGFGRAIPLNSSDWISVPAISDTRGNAGFLIWDITSGTVEAVSLKMKFKILLTR